MLKNNNNFTRKEFQIFILGKAHCRNISGFILWCIKNDRFILSKIAALALVFNFF